MKKYNAFTLLEVMIVVAIIGLLAAIAIPNLAKTRQKAMDRQVAELKAQQETQAIALKIQQSQWVGIPATSELLQTNDDYEVIASWRDKTANPVLYYTLLRDRNHQIRLFTFTQALSSGFYRTTPAHQLEELTPVSLEKNP